jgi:dipeptidyl aminopeptidase/acylaminoacyl peptidase
VLLALIACSREAEVRQTLSDARSTPSNAGNVAVATMVSPSAQAMMVATGYMFIVSPTWTSTLTIEPSPTDTITPTPNPYAELTIEHLVERPYGGGSLEIVETLSENSYFTRYLFKYPSDGLSIYGFMNVPKRNPPFPVIIALHGYIDPQKYQTLDYTTSYADALARAGYLVLHPNLRGYPPSEDGFNLFRVGMAVDVLNLIALVREWAGRPGPLEQADAEHLGLWGHSMGGGISLRVLTISPEVDAAVLYAAMSGDERQNYEAIYRWSDGQRGLAELSIPVDALTHISPIFYLERIQAAVSIHHGRNDELVPLDWSLDLCQRLSELDKVVECFTYNGQPHTFTGEGNEVFMQRVNDFFERYLKLP